MVGLAAADARRGDRRRQRDPRRHRRGDAVAGDRGRAVPGRGDRDDGADRRADRDDRAVRATGTRSACSATSATRPTRRLQRVRGRAAARAWRRSWCPTLSGRSARLISAHRPEVPIYALSPGRETVRRCKLMWGVQAASIRRHEKTEELIAESARRAVELGWVKQGDRDRHHRRAAERAAGHDVAAAGAGGLMRRRGRGGWRCCRWRWRAPPASAQDGRRRTRGTSASASARRLRRGARGARVAGRSSSTRRPRARPEHPRSGTSRRASSRRCCWSPT